MRKIIKVFGHRVAISDGQLYPTFENSKLQNFKSVLSHVNGAPIMYMMY
jgi:hypothetical protein